MDESALHQLLQQQREAYYREPIPTLASRRAALARLRQALLDHRDALVAAVDQDFGGRAAAETLLGEVLPAVQAIDHARRHLRRWMRPQRRRVPLVLQPAAARVVYQPLGVVGIMAPWNYPVNLALVPLISALAAGNRVLLKPSEFTPATAEALRALLAEAFAPDRVAVVQGGVEVSRAFAALPLDHLLFTGSTATGRHIMRAAADNLTPVTLELGGKSPAIIGPEGPVADAAANIAFGKTFNAGQTCVAPDYVLCPRVHLQAFADAFRAEVTRLYPRLADNPDYSAIVNPRHHRRLRELLEDAARQGARLEPVNPAGEELEDSGKLAPTLVWETSDAMAIRQEEIFGPWLPVIPYDTLDEALAYVRARPRPLALYYLGRDAGHQRRVQTETHSGGLCINDTLAHLLVDELPFGGIGPSGMGHYHGGHGFETFSKAKPVFRRGRLNSSRLARPPYGWRQRLIYRWFLR